MNENESTKCLPVLEIYCQKIFKDDKTLVILKPHTNVVSKGDDLASILQEYFHCQRKMPPKKRPRMSQKAAASGKQRVTNPGPVVLSRAAVISSPGKADDGGKLSAAQASVGGKRKATGRSKESVKADDPAQHSHWLMKSEPESRFENGIDVKVRADVPGCSPECRCGLTGLAHLSVRDRRSEGYVGPNQLLGRSSEFSGGSVEAKRPKIAFLCPTHPRRPLTAGAQFYEADEDGAVGLLLPQQLQGAGDSRAHEGKSGVWPAGAHIS